MADVLVVAVLGTGVVPVTTPVLRADDLGVLRGDGAFETMHVRKGEPWLLEEHLARLAHSADRLDLPLPPVGELAGLVKLACEAWPATGGDEAALRLVCTRGPESGGGPTVYATVAEVSPAVLKARRQGISVSTAALAVETSARGRAPWLLSGVKSLSYAVNMASLRWASACGADDVLWVSVDGYALEGPTASLVWLDRGVLCTVPPRSTGILAGTTATWLLANAASLGWQSEERMIRPGDLNTVDGAWFTSSVRGLAEIRSVDGTPLRPSAATERIREALGFPS